MDGAFGVVSKKSLPYPRSSRNLIVLCFTFRSIFFFELIFVNGLRSVSRFIFWHGCLHLTFGMNILSLKKTNVEAYEGSLLFNFTMFTFIAYQTNQSITTLGSNYCKNLSRFSVFVSFPTPPTYRFGHIRLNFSPGPIYQRNKKCLFDIFASGWGLKPGGY